MICHLIFCRVRYAECRTWQRLCRVLYGLYRVPEALDKEAESGSGTCVLALFCQELGWRSMTLGPPQISTPRPRYMIVQKQWFLLGSIKAALATYPPVNI
jgi:hypothetical protein